MIFLDFQRDTLDLIHHPVLVRFQVGTTDLLGFGSNSSEHTYRPWRAMMLPAFAVWGLASLRIAQRHGRALLDLEDYGDDLLFQMDNIHILVQCTSSPDVARVPYTALFAAWNTFAQSVYEYVVLRHPDEYTQTWVMKKDSYPEPILEQWLLRPSS